MIQRYCARLDTLFIALFRLKSISWCQINRSQDLDYALVHGAHWKSWKKILKRIFGPKYNIQSSNNLLEPLDHARLTLREKKVVWKFLLTLLSIYPFTLNTVSAFVNRLGPCCLVALTPGYDS